MSPKPAKEVTAMTTARHVAIIMDGNGRWAKRRGMPRTFGHQAGVNALKRTVEAAPQLGIQWLTVFGFSTENWRRPASEVSELMGLLKAYVKTDLARLEREGVRVIPCFAAYRNAVRDLELPPPATATSIVRHPH